MTIYFRYWGYYSDYREKERLTIKSSLRRVHALEILF